MRCTQKQFSEIIKANSQIMSPLFAVPGFVFYMICIDMLHAVDLGIAQEIVGNIFWEALGLFAPGKNHKLQVAELERKLKAHYSRMKIRNRIGRLTKDMIRRNGKALRLVAQGAETKHVVPFALEIAVALHAAKGDEHSHKELQCVSGLLDFYMCSTMKPYPVQSAQDATRIVATAYVDFGHGSTCAAKLVQDHRENPCLLSSAFSKPHKLHARAEVENEF